MASRVNRSASYTSALTWLWIRLGLLPTTTGAQAVPLYPLKRGATPVTTISPVRNTRSVAGGTMPTALSPPPMIVR